MEEVSRILIITDTFYLMGGAERNIVQIISRLDRNKFHPILCCLRTGELSLSVASMGVQIIDLNLKSVFSLRSLKKFSYLVRLINKEKITLILSYHTSSDFLGFFLSKVARIPIISSKRDMGYLLGKRHKLAYKILGRFFDATITVSDAVKREIVNRDKVPISDVFTIYNGVDINQYQEKTDIEKKKKEIGLESNKPVVGIIAGLRKIKGIDYFVKAAVLLLKRGVDAQFIIVGHDPGEAGCNSQDLKEFLKNSGINSGVHFIGKRDDIAELLHIIDISVLCSLSEGFSNTILESMAAGKPVIASNVGGNPESVINGYTGVLVPPADSLSLAQAIDKLLKDRATAEKMGKEALQLAKNKFSLDRMVRANEEVFKFVIEKKKTKNQWFYHNWLWIKGILIQVAKLAISSVVYYLGGIKIYQWFQKKVGKPVVKILAYHNISDTYPQYLDLGQGTESFKKQLEFLSANYEIVSLQDGIKQLTETKKKSNFAVISFDDCYKDIFSNAYPVIKKLNIPATCFITVRPIETGIPLPVDLLIYAIANTKLQYLNLKDLGLNNYVLVYKFQKEKAIVEINDQIKRMRVAERYEFIEKIFYRLQISFNEAKQKNEVMNWKDIREMLENGIDIGSHTLTHCDLASVSLQEADEEIGRSKELLEKILGSKVAFFSYPFGGSGNINEETVNIVRLNGYQGAVTLTQNRDLDFNFFSLPRISVCRGMYEGPFGGFFKSLFAIEVSGLSHYLFLRFLRYNEDINNYGIKSKSFKGWKI